MSPLCILQISVHWIGLTRHWTIIIRAVRGLTPFLLFYESGDLTVAALSPWRRSTQRTRSSLSTYPLFLILISVHWIIIKRAVRPFCLLSHKTGDRPSPRGPRGSGRRRGHALSCPRFHISTSFFLLVSVRLGEPEVRGITRKIALHVFFFFINPS